MGCFYTLADHGFTIEDAVPYGFKLQRLGVPSGRFLVVYVFFGGKKIKINKGPMH